MALHHLNCISACALGGMLMDGRSVSHIRGRLASHCMLLETGAGLVLVDTGYGLRDVHDPKGRLSRFFLFMNSPDFREAMTAVRQIEALGYSARDVRHVVLTHLDFDHAGGLDDFPEATVHLLSRERDAAFEQKTALDRARYRSQQWSSRDRWRVYPDGDEGDAWFGFRAVRALEGLPPEIALVPLRGHTFGHAGVAVQTGPAWILLAGDAYFYRDEMDFAHPSCTPGLRFYQALMEKDRDARLDNQRRLRQLKAAHGTEVTIVSSHDAVEFEKLAGRALDVPLGHVQEATEVPRWAEAHP